MDAERIGSDADLGALGGQLRGIAEGLCEMGEIIQRAIAIAQDGRYEACSPCGMIEATVDGRNRITGLWLSPRIAQDHVEAEANRSIADRSA